MTLDSRDHEIALAHLGNADAEVTRLKAKIEKADALATLIGYVATDDAMPLIGRLVVEGLRAALKAYTGVVPGRSEHMPTHRCLTCGGLWKLHDNGVWAPRSIATACCSGAVPPIDVELEEYEGTPGGGT